MDRVQAFFAALYAAALAVWAIPALALAQGASTGRAPSTGGAAAPGSTPTADTGGGGSGTSWLWIVIALIVLAIIWWAMSSRRRGTAAR